MKATSYRFTVPPTREQGSYSGNCRAFYMESRAQNALANYNSARAHDGLQPLSRMPKGTRYTRIVSKARANVSVKVIFRRFPARLGGDVIALFPALAGTVSNPGHCLSYQTVGQHGAADLLAMTHTCRLAKPGEFRELARELRRIGYRLDIRRKATRTDYEARKAQLAA